MTRNRSGSLMNSRDGIQRQDSQRSTFSKNFKLSGSKFFNKPPESQRDDDYVVVKDGITYELEIAPIVFYLQEVAPNGEL
jgi:hypothetical protein